MVKSARDIKIAVSRFALIQKRRKEPRCLVCGCQNIKPFNGNLELSSNQDGEQGSSKTGFLHPECNGELIASPGTYENLANVGREVFKYSVSGSKLTELNEIPSG